MVRRGVDSTRMIGPLFKKSKSMYFCIRKMDSHSLGTIQYAEQGNRNNQQMQAKDAGII